MKGYLYTAVWGVFVWLAATFFFVLWGEHVLKSPGADGYVGFQLLLAVGTGILLAGVTFLYGRFDRSKKAPLKFGIVGTWVGLTLDSFSLSYHNVVFPQLESSQIISFTVWMSFAYGLYLLIPAVMYILQKRLLTK